MSLPPAKIFLEGRIHISVAESDTKIKQAQHATYAVSVENYQCTDVGKRITMPLEEALAAVRVPELPRTICHSNHTYEYVGYDNVTGMWMYKFAGENRGNYVEHFIGFDYVTAWAKAEETV